MECDQCGAPRPRWGACPECGAPPPRFSSQSGPGASGTRGRSLPGSGSRGGSGAQWGSGSSGGGLLRRDSGSPRRGKSADGWEDEYDNYTNASPSRSGGRFSSGDHGIDPSRALVPQQQYNEVMPPSAEGGLMVGLPGFPQTDEEERAIGMRRPAYIPATEPKRKRKLSSGRVVSGLLSILLVTVGVCGGLAFAGQKQLERITGPFKIVMASPTVDLRQIPATPASTPGPQAKIVQSVVTAHAIDAKYNAEDESTIFLVNSTVYVVANIVGASQTTANTFSCTWYLNGVNYQLNSGKQTSLPAGKASNFHAYCALPYYQTGIGMVRLYWNRPASDSNDGPNDAYLAQTIKFAVVASMPTTPAPGTPKPGVTPSPTKSAYISQPVVWRSEYTAG